MGQISFAAGALLLLVNVYFIRRRLMDLLSRHRA